MQQSVNTSADGDTTTATNTPNHAKLTADQTKRWADTMTMMVWTAPGFQHLLYKLLNAQNDGGEHVAVMSKDGCQIAQTDGQHVVVNPDSYFLMNLPERVFVLAHEVIHNVYDDVGLLHRCSLSGSVPMNDGTARPFRNDVMQKSMDARINAALIESNIGKPPKVSPALKQWLDAKPGVGQHYAVGDPFGHFDKEVKGTDSVLDIYKKYYEAEEENPDGGQDTGNNPGGFDTLMKPGASSGQNPAQAQSQRNNQQWAVEIAAAQTIEQARNQGNMAAGLKRFFKNLLEPEVPWVDHIETLISRALGSGGYDWSKPHDYFGGTDTGDQYFCPSEAGTGAGWIVVWGDTSGSRSDLEIAENIAELAGIMEQVNPRRLTILWCDAAIDNDPGTVVEITDIADIKNLKPTGGGGTDYEPVLDWMKGRNDDTPDLFIGFTDGYVTHVKESEFPCPVIWASSTDQKYPFGQVVRVNKLKRARP